MKERYRFSQYVIDLNRRNFKTVLATVKKIKERRIDPRAVVADTDGILILHPEDIKDVVDYFFRKATREVQQFYK